MAGRKREEIPDAGATMQIDAIADELEDYEAADDLGAAPPPLPPQGGSKAGWIVGALVVLLAAGLGIAAGVYLLGGGAAPAAQAAPAAAAPAPVAAPSEPAPSEPAEPAAMAGELDEPVAPEGSEAGEPERLQMDEIVFGDDP